MDFSNDPHVEAFRAQEAKKLTAASILGAPPSHPVPRLSSSKRAAAKSVSKWLAVFGDMDGADLPKMGSQEEAALPPFAHAALNLLRRACSPIPQDNPTAAVNTVMDRTEGPVVQASLVGRLSGEYAGLDQAEIYELLKRQQTKRTAAEPIDVTPRKKAPLDDVDPLL